MKKEELYDLLGGIDEKYVEEAKAHKGALKRGRALRIVIAAAFAVERYKSFEIRQRIAIVHGL